MWIRLALSLIFSVALQQSAQAAVLWVGNSPACTGSAVHATLDQALLVAALNGDSTDEIRLTRTVTYTGNGAGSYTLADWSATGPGRLTLAGGYPDCFTAANGQTRLGDTNAPVFEIRTSSQSNSEVTLRNLLINNSAQYGITASQGAVVTLQGVEISNSNGGLSVGAGAFVAIDASSLIQHNERSAPDGGGIFCAGSNSSVQMAGSLFANSAWTNGGNIYVGNGCFVELLDGARIRGFGINGINGAQYGAGLFVASNAQLHAKGRAQRVIIHDHRASYGGGLFVDGGLAILENVHFDSNRSSAEGASITLNNGGQLFMDRTADCPLGGLRCSEIQSSVHGGHAVFVRDSFAQIQRTLIERSTHAGVSVLAVGLVHGHNSDVRLNRVGFVDNEMFAAVGASTAARMRLSHLTIAANRHPTGGASASFVNRGYSDASLQVENSLLADTLGTDWFGGSFAGKCNLINTAADRGTPVWPNGSYAIGTASFTNIGGNDPHQTPSSLGVDMCQRDTFSWSTEIDLDMESAPVNESTNPQGLPGEAGGLYEAGFDEVYANVGQDEFTLAVSKAGSGEGVVISNPAGVSCGSDCSHVYFNGTTVTLNAAPINGSSFVGWFNCPLVNVDNQCLVGMITDRTVRAEFALISPTIFSDGFE